MEGDKTASGSSVKAENILVMIGTWSLPDAAMSHFQLVEGVEATSAADGRSIGEIWGLTRNATKGAQ
jgi:hypothetical protein